MEEELWPPLQEAFEADRALAKTLVGLRSDHRPDTVEAIGEAFRRGFKREAISLLGRLEPYFTKALMDDVVAAAPTMAVTHRVRYLLGRLPHQQAQELVPPAADRCLERESDSDAWMRIAELFEHLGLYDDLRELCVRARDHIDPDVREVAEYFTRD